jgi:hypothetical protein
MRSIFAPGLQASMDDSCAEKMTVCTYPKAGLYLFNALHKIYRVAVELKGLFTLQCKTLVTMLTGLLNFSRAFSRKVFAGLSRKPLRLWQSFRPTFFDPPVTGCTAASVSS